VGCGDTLEHHAGLPGSRQGQQVRNRATINSISTAPQPTEYHFLCRSRCCVSVHLFPPKRASCLRTIAILAFATIITRTLYSPNLSNSRCMGLDPMTRDGKTGKTVQGSHKLWRAAY
jgi:hypothetical protein